MSPSDLMLGAGARLGLALATPAAPRLSILIFHRVLPQPDPVFPLELDAARFDRLMGLVRRSFNVLPLEAAVDGLAAGRLPPRAMAITFDDGYADNHDVALPILRCHGLHATFFIATGFLDGGRMFNDTVIESLRHSPLTELDAGDFGLGRLPIGTPALKAAAIGQLLGVIKYQSPAEREPSLARLRTRAPPRHRPDDLMMRSDQVQAMAAAGMGLGAHTLDHPILCSIEDAEVARQMRGSRDRLQQLVQAPVDLFAYPNGRPDRDYARRHAELARGLGFKAAVTTAPGVARPGDDLFELPRFTPWQAGAWPWMARLVACRRQPGYQRAGLAAA
jgi:peptidoglycan/xylan/chitin deacetylase (PgdA/CDA1 family)